MTCYFGVRYPFFKEIFRVLNSLILLILGATPIGLLLRRAHLGVISTSLVKSSNKGPGRPSIHGKGPIRGCRPLQSKKDSLGRNCIEDGRPALLSFQHRLVAW